MAKRPGRGPCVHCLQEVEDRDWDHVIPEGWYPENTPENLEKWKIPSCQPCNKAYGEIENDLLLRLGMCIGPEEALAAGIGEKALRSIKPEFAKDDRDRAARQARRDMVKREMFRLDSPEVEGVFPNFGARPHLTYDEYMAIPIPADGLTKYGEKLVRGMTYLRTNRLVPPTHRIKVWFVKDEDASSVLALLRSKGRGVDRGPGVVVEYALALDDGISALFYVTLWGRFKFWALLYPLDREDEIMPLASGTSGQLTRPST